MPPAKAQRWERRPNWQKSGSVDAAQPDEIAPAEVVPRPPSIGALERRQLYARLLWLADYPLILAAEAATNAQLLAALTTSFVSGYTRRLIRMDTLQGRRAAQAVEQRLRDSIGFLERSRNRLHVPISQAAKAISYLCSGVAKPVWEAERKARRVVRCHQRVVLERVGTAVLTSI